MPRPVVVCADAGLHGLAIDDVGTGHGLREYGVGIMEEGHYTYHACRTWEEMLQAVLRDLEERREPPRPVTICQGDCLDHIAKELARLGYAVTRARIEGPLQDKTEESFRDHLIELGVPGFLADNAFQYARFAAQLLGWFFADPLDRERFLARRPERKTARVSFGHLQKSSRCMICYGGMTRGEPAGYVEVVHKGKLMTRAPFHPECRRVTDEDLMVYDPPPAPAPRPRRRVGPAKGAPPEPRASVDPPVRRTPPAAPRPSAPYAPRPRRRRRRTTRPPASTGPG